MKIIPLGAAGGVVTGSAYLVMSDNAAIMIDCGLFQGGKEADEKNRDFDVRQVCEINSILLTHAHLDHTGRLPLLSRAGCRKPIHATEATIDMTKLILRDSARIQISDNERLNRKRIRAGEDLFPPLYTPADVEAILPKLKSVDYQRPIEVAPGMVALFAESGHMLGSASIQLTVREDGTEKVIVFSGDLGPRTMPILKEYEPFGRADMVILESTYGDRDHRPVKETIDEFQGIIQEVVEKKGKILIPTFAVGRAQLLLTLLATFFRRGLVRPFPIFLDSPMAIEATKIYQQHEYLYDDEMRELIDEAPMMDDLKTLVLSQTAEDSKRINDIPGPCLVLAGSGMCNGGRILHHLRANLWKPDTHVIIVGYQARGTIGRQIVDGEKLIKIFGEPIAVKGKVHTLGGFSAHAGQTDLLYWLEKLAPCRPRLVLTHGEDPQRHAFAKKISEKFQLKAHLPEIGEVMEL